MGDTDIQIDLELILIVFKLIVVIFVGADQHRCSKPILAVFELIVAVVVVVVVVVVDGDIGDVEGPEAVEVEVNCSETSE